MVTELYESIFAQGTLMPQLLSLAGKEGARHG